MNDEAIDFVCGELKNNLGKWGKLNSKWVYPFAEMVVKFHQSKIQNIENELGDSLPSIPETEYDDFDTKDDLYAAGYDGDM